MNLPNIFLQDFAKENSLDISSFENCYVQTNLIVNSIKSLYTIPPFSPDEDLVVFGSIARKECVTGSDVDWTLLVDGQANPRHSLIENDIRRKFRNNHLNSPGASEMFGHISFSHELIHNIGGQSDTNHNLTKRILLLLESSCLPLNTEITNNGTAYGRVIKGILSQYIEHDSGLNSNRAAIPRYLLNDVVRFWRTMCVDFAYKQKEQEGEKWALRNIKLRISRKMLFVKGMLMCVSHHAQNQDKADLIQSLENMSRLTSIELLINLQKHFNIDQGHISDVIRCYNSFLSKLNDVTIRETLAHINMNNIYNEPCFIDLRNIADDLQSALNKIFLGSGNLSPLILQYGIF